MKIMIASDIHGSAYYCEKMLNAFSQEHADRLLLLGDLLYHGPRNDLPKCYEPKKVISMLNCEKENLLCVKGNCDTEVDQMVLDFPILADYCILQMGEKYVFATHGHKFNPSSPPPLPSNSILLCGHTHIPKCTFEDNFVYMNPGSVSIPKENSYHGYMLFDDGQFYWKDFHSNTKSSICFDFSAFDKSHH